MKGILYLFVLSQIRYYHCTVLKSYQLDQFNYTINNTYIPKELNTRMTDDNSTDNDSWECSRSEKEKQEHLEAINLMLQETDSVIDNQSVQERKVENTILILGNAGAGKTTFVQFMAGNNSKLMSREIGNETGEFVIEDDLKIGNSVTESFTLYPETMLVERNQSEYISFTDTPGFSDTRSEKHEVITMYAMKKYLKGFKRLKLALLITYNSVQYGMYKDDFIELLRNVNIFIKDIDRFKHNIVLVATKVPNNYRVVDGKGILVQNKKVIDGIGIYLHHVRTSLMEKLTESHETRETEFLTNCIKIVDHLLETNINGDYVNINIFRKPSEIGPLSKIKTLQENKESLFKTLLNDSNNYTEISDKNIGYALSSRAKNYLNCLFWYLNENAKKWSEETFYAITVYYQNYLSNYTDIYELNSRIDGVLTDLKNMKEQGRLSNNITTSIQMIENFFKCQTNSTVTQRWSYIQIHDRISELKQFSEDKHIFLATLWSEQMKPLLNYVEQESSWYNFLIKLFDFCTSYKIQKDNSLYYKELVLNDDHMPRALLANEEFPYYEHFNFYTEPFSALEIHKSEELKNLLSLCLQQQTQISCEPNSTLNIRGYFVKISELNNYTNFVYCNNTGVKAIGILAIHKVFIDSDVKNDMIKGINLIISAPIWEVIGQKTIDISGHDGRHHQYHKADNGTHYGENGKDGIPGYPGGNGGTLLIMGSHFINDIELKINVSGGTGGAGQNGGDGHIGKNGTEGYKKFYHYSPNNNNYNESWKHGQETFPFTVTKVNGIDFYPDELELMNQNIEPISHSCDISINIYSQTGECGEVGGSGGAGGSGGFGGQPGKVDSITENNPPRFTIINSFGNRGVPGISGKGGKSGAAGKDMMCFKISSTGHYARRELWRCAHYTNTIIPTRCSTCTTEDENINLINATNSNDKGITRPSQSSKCDFSKEIYQYINLLKNETNVFLSENTKNLVKIILRGLNKPQNNLWHIFVLTENIN